LARPSAIGQFHRKGFQQTPHHSVKGTLRSWFPEDAIGNICFDINLVFHSENNSKMEKRSSTAGISYCGIRSIPECLMAESWWGANTARQA
jgi:hypothetical protein